MRKQLEDLATLIRFIDPPLMDALEQNDVGNVYFTFRWLLVFMKREFKVSLHVLLKAAYCQGLTCYSPG